MNNKGVRLPLLPLSFSKEAVGLPGEIILDLDNSEIYIKDELGTSNIRVPNSNMIDGYIDIAYLSIIGNVGQDSNNVSKLYSELEDLLKWKLDLDKGIAGTIDGTQDVFNSVKNIKVSDGSILEQLDKKINMLPGRVLSDNDFTDILLDKLLNIEDGANKYVHPKYKVCSYSPPVRTINGKYGDVVLTKADIPGLEDVHPDANFYEHPRRQECTYEFPVKSVQNRHGNVVVTKNDVELNLIQNLKTASVKNILDTSATDDYYMTPGTLYSAISKALFGESGPKDGRFALKFELVPDFAKVIVYLRPFVESGTNYTEWTNGLLYRLHPGIYEYKIEESEDWNAIFGLIEVVDEDIIKPIVLDDVESFYVSIINSNGPLITSAYIYPEPFNISELMSTNNGKSTHEVMPGTIYRYILRFGDDFPNAYGEFVMPGKDYTIIHSGGGTSDDQGQSDEDMFSPPSNKGKVAISVSPAGSTIKVYDKYGSLFSEGGIFEVDYYEDYTYIISKDGYMSESDTIYVQPWEDITNIDIILKKLKDIEFKVNPITIDKVSVRIEVNGTYVEVPKIDEYYNQYVYPNGIVDGDVNDEFSHYAISNLPPGSYNYKIYIDDIELDSGSVDHSITETSLKTIKISTNMNRYYRIIPDITPASIASACKVSVSENGGSFSYIDIEDGYKLFGISKDISIKVECVGYITTIENISFSETPINKGGVVTIPLLLNKIDSIVDDFDDTNSDITESFPEYKDDTSGGSDMDIIETGYLIIETIPENVSLIVDGIGGENITIDGKRYKRFSVNYNTEYSYSASLTGYVSNTGKITKKKSSPNIDKTISLFKTGEFVLKVNPSTVKGMKPQIKIDGIWTDLIKGDVVIPNQEYSVTGTGVTSIDNEYGIYKIDNLPTGMYDYRVITGSDILSSDKVYHSATGSSHDVYVGNTLEKYYNIYFDIYHNSSKITDSKIEVYVDSEWVEINNSLYKIYGDINNIRYRISNSKYITHIGAKTFKESASVGGGNVTIKIELEPNPDSLQSINDNGKDPAKDEKYFRYSVSPIDANVRIECLDRNFYVNGTLKSEPYYSANNTPVLSELNGITCYQDIVKKYPNTPNSYKGFVLKVSKDGYESAEVTLSWDDISKDGVHADLFISKLIKIDCRVNPINIDGLKVKLINSEEEVILYKGGIDKEYVGNNTISNYTKTLKDIQYVEYIKNSGKYTDRVVSGLYEYSAYSDLGVLQTGKIIIDENNKLLNIDIESSDLRYYMIDFIIPNYNSDTTTVSIYETTSKKWRVIKGTSYKYFGDDSHIIYSIKSKGFENNTDILNLYEHRSTGGCKIKIPVELHPGTSLPDLDISNMGPSDETLVSGNRYIRLIATNSDGLPINGAIIDIMGLTKKTVIFNGFMCDEFIVKDGTYNVTVSADGYEKTTIYIDSKNIMLKEIFENCYAIKLYKTESYIINLHPITIDNVKIGIGKYTTNESKIDIIKYFDKGKETLTSFKNNSIYEKESVEYSIKDISDRYEYGYYVYINNFLDRIVKPIGKQTNIDLGSNFNRYFDLRLDIRCARTKEELDIEVYTMVKNTWSKVSKNMVRINMLSEETKIKITSAGYRDEIFTINPRFAEDAIHDGRVVEYSLNMTMV